jgi:hypothetical protein
MHTNVNVTRSRVNSAEFRPKTGKFRGREGSVKLVALSLSVNSPLISGAILESQLRERS